MPSIFQIKSRELRELIQHQQVELIDVRTPEEYHEMNIPTAKLLPLSELSLDQLQHFDESKKWVIHCRSGHRSMLACQLLIDQGLQKDIGNLEGGILDWITHQE